MKIYINNLNLELLKYISELFKEYLIHTERFIQLYTNEGIYRIEDKNIFYLDACDKDIILLDKYYKDFTLIVDPSFFHKQLCSSVHGETHLCFHIQKNSYKLSKISDLSLIIEYSYDNNEIFISHDIYFESDKVIDLNNPFIKKELIEFLSHLN